MKISITFLVVVSAMLMVACGSASFSASTNTPAASSEPAAAEPQDVRLEGDHLQIDRHINFATDSDEILADSNDLLDHIAAFINSHRAQIGHLRIIGHTDAAGGAEANQALSERRAAAVAQALSSRGVTIQLEHSGVGETQHLCNEDTDACHAQNRRVEFLVVAD